MEDKFIYAAGYYPMMQEESVWEKDLQTLKGMGIKLLRTAELFGTWDTIEAEEGCYNFTVLDKFFDLCHKYDIKIMLGTGTASPPLWIHEKYPDVNIKNNHGDQYPNSVSYSWACVDHPEFINSAEKYITELVNHYKNHPALYAYQIHNEISFPFMPLKGGDIDIYCYCDHSEKKFQSWLKTKYQKIEDLNYAYRWGATNNPVSNFNQVKPPKTKSTSWASITRWLDWRLFWMENIVDFVSWQNKLIKQHDSNHITTTNIFFLKAQDPLGVITALDQFEMAKVVDIIGYDLYPSSGNKLEKMCEFSSMFLDMAKSTAKAIGKNYWLLETEAGPINHWVLGPSKTVTGQDIMRNIFEAIGHDSKMTLYQLFKESDFQPIHWGGLVDLDGNRNHLTDVADEIGKLTNELEDFIGKAHNKDAKIAILISKENAIVLNAMGQDDFLLKAMRGAYRGFSDKNFNVEFITIEHLENNYVSKYPIVYMPFMVMIEENTAKLLEQYVYKGGHLIGTARMGMLGKHGHSNHSLPPFTLEQVFGFRTKQIYAGSNPQITYRKKTYQGAWHKEIIQVKETTKILARYNDDNAAITVNQYGKGSATYFATHPDVAYVEEGSLLLFDFLDDYCKKLQIRQTVDINYSGRKDREIRADYLTDSEKGLLIITTYVNSKNKGFYEGNEKLVEVSIEDKYRTAYDVIQNKEIPISVIDGRSECSIYLKKEEVLLIKLEQ